MILVGYGAESDRPRILGRYNILYSCNNTIPLTVLMHNLETSQIQKMNYSLHICSFIPVFFYPKLHGIRVLCSLVIQTTWAFCWIKQQPLLPLNNLHLDKYGHIKFHIYTVRGKTMLVIKIWAALTISHQIIFVDTVSRHSTPFVFLGGAHYCDWNWIIREPLASWSPGYSGNYRYLLAVLLKFLSGI